VAVYQDFALSLIDYINQQTPYESYKQYKEFFNAPGVFDGLVNVLLQELRKKPMRAHLADKSARYHLIDQIVLQVMDMCEEKKFKLHDFAEIAQYLPIMKLHLDKKYLSPGFVELQEQDKIVYKLYL
jgi:hypothetical protein